MRGDALVYSIPDMTTNKGKELTFPRNIRQFSLGLFVIKQYSNFHWLPNRSYLVLDLLLNAMFVVCKWPLAYPLVVQYRTVLYIAWYIIKVKKKIINMLPVVKMSTVTHFNPDASICAMYNADLGVISAHSLPFLNTPTVQSRISYASLCLSLPCE